MNVVERDVPFAALNLAHVRAVKFRLVRQLLLAQSDPAANLSNALPKVLTLFGQFGVSAGHSSTVGVWCL